MQLALCRAVRKLATYRAEASLLTWLCTICRHEIHDWFERQRRVPPMVDLVEDLPEVRAALDSLDALQKETARLVQVVLDRQSREVGSEEAASLRRGVQHESADPCGRIESARGSDCSRIAYFDKTPSQVVLSLFPLVSVE